MGLELESRIEAGQGTGTYSHRGEIPEGNVEIVKTLGVEGKTEEEQAAGDSSAKRLESQMC